MHGVPNKTPFKEGDWTNLDVTIFTDGFYGDNSITITFGDVLPEI